MRKLLILFALLLVVLACTEVGPMDATTRKYALGKSFLTESKRIFDWCDIQYSVLNAPAGAQAFFLQKASEVPFDLWESAQGSLKFSKAADPSLSDITIQFTDSAVFTNVPLKEGLVAQEIPALAAVSSDTAGKSVIYLRYSANWTTQLLQYVLLHQIGNALGVVTCSDAGGGVFSEGETLSISLSDCEIESVRNVYSEKCDQWVKLENLPFELARSVRKFEAGGNLYVILNELDPPAMFEFNPVSGQWATRNLFSSYDESDYVFSATIGGTGYVIQEGRLSGTSNNYVTISRYIPPSGNSTDRWEVAARFNSSNNIVPTSFFAVAIHDKIYTFSWQSYVGSYYVFNPKINTVTSLIDLWSSAQWIDYYKPNDVFVYKNSAFLNDYYSSNYIFTPTNSRFWSTTAGVGGEAETHTQFLVKDRLYVISGSIDNTKIVERYSLEIGVSSLELLQPVPIVGKLAFSFVINNKAYVATHNGEFWMYRP